MAGYLCRKQCYVVSGSKHPPPHQHTHSQGQRQTRARRHLLIRVKAELPAARQRFLLVERIDALPRLEGQVCTDDPAMGAVRMRVTI